MLRTRVYHSPPMRHSVRVRPLVTLICAACTLAIPAAASASDSSPVHVDPGSPVAKEYALPLASARGAAPESGKSGSLFGSGLGHGDKPTPPKTVTTQAPPEAVTETKTYTATPPTTSAATSPPVTTPPVTTPPVTTPPVTTPPATTPPAATPQATISPATTPQATRTRPVKPPQPGPKDVITVTLPDLPTTTAATLTKTTVSAAPAAYQVLRPGSGSGVLWMVLAGVLVVAVGSAGGLALARRR
jgi:hypothetical protein